LNRAAREPSFAVPGLSQLIQPGPPGTDKGELSCDKEGVGKDENDDG
jgi:hypothetical protein